jgi:predicted regulator of amino acid metabolism with ACT domain
MPGRYQTFSREAMDFVKDKLAIVDSLHNVQANIPRIDSDWHLRTVYKNVEREFDIDDLSKAVDTKLERIEQSYNSARDFISTNFFIAVEIVLILSLAWMMLDTSLLFVIAQK